jgi:hypothetical protein
MEHREKLFKVYYHFEQSNLNSYSEGVVRIMAEDEDEAWRRARNLILRGCHELRNVLCIDSVVRPPILY